MEMLALVFAGLILKGIALHIYSKWETIKFESMDSLQD